MKSSHKIIYRDSKKMEELENESIDLIVTSPPYPMIEMWDEIFTLQNNQIGRALKSKNGPLAFELMNKELDKVWSESYRVLKEGGIACINIGDATRTINGHFALYTSHSRIQQYAQKIGFSALPAILWRKQTNAPNKFMGSGMMPPGAYVTLEHEYVLILRKGNKREFKTHKEKMLRRESAFFWEERNNWFSDVWMDLKGTAQNLFDNKTRSRSAAFPFEVPYRLITMFSVKGDTVLDPFLGIGTTMYAAISAGRNSVGYEIDKHFHEAILSKIPGITAFSNNRISERFEKHFEFVEAQFKKRGKFKYSNCHYQFPVMTRQETDLMINEVISVAQTGEGSFEAVYADDPQSDYVGFWDGYVMSNSENKGTVTTPRKRKSNHKQQNLF
ncbi:MAG: site-specific DNA-methyltransferase [Desulfobacterales bacterium]|nr:site-specific DNA-methyltransferase [Desulfobacterales bacterium]